MKFVLLAMLVAFGGNAHAQAQTGRGAGFVSPILPLRLDTVTPLQHMARDHPATGGRGFLTRSDSSTDHEPSVGAVSAGVLLGGAIGLAVGYALEPRSGCSDCGVPRWKVKRALYWGAGLGVIVGGGLGLYFSYRV